MNEYLCSECNIQLSKFELGLNTLYPIGKLYCENCKITHEKKILKKLTESLTDLSIYDFKKYKSE